jgi:predicted DNA-binding protein with PD1-like motif
MEMAVDTGGVLVRLGPGEDLHDAVHLAFDEGGRAFPVLTSCIGSLEFLDYGVAMCDEQGIPGPGRRFLRPKDALEIGGIHGHVGVDDEGRPSSHLHGVVFDVDGGTLGGHIFEAKTLITVEFALLGRDAPRWHRVHRPVSGSPPLPLLVPRTREEPS